jgi:hypothetical protein
MLECTISGHQRNISKLYRISTFLQEIDFAKDLIATLFRMAIIVYIKQVIIIGYKCVC